MQLRDEMAEMQGRMDVALEEAAAVCEERDAAFSALTDMHDRVESAEKAHRKAMRTWHKKVREEKQRQGGLSCARTSSAKARCRC